PCSLLTRRHGEHVMDEEDRQARVAAVLERAWALIEKGEADRAKFEEWQRNRDPFAEDVLEAWRRTRPQPEPVRREAHCMTDYQIARLVAERIAESTEQTNKRTEASIEHAVECLRQGTGQAIAMYCQELRTQLRAEIEQVVRTEIKAHE